MYLMIIDYFKVKPGTPLFCSGILTGMHIFWGRYESWDFLHVFEHQRGFAEKLDFKSFKQNQEPNEKSYKSEWKC